MRIASIFVQTLFATLAISAVAAAGSFDEYATEPPYAIELPPATTSFFALATGFGAEAPGDIDGYPVASRLLAAANSRVYFQKNLGASQWLVVGSVQEPMDPSFIEVSPDGAKVRSVSARHARSTCFRSRRSASQTLLIPRACPRARASPSTTTTAAGATRVISSERWDAHRERHLRGRHRSQRSRDRGHHGHRRYSWCLWRGHVRIATGT